MGRTIAIILLIAAIFSAKPSRAEQVVAVAVAANFATAMEEVAALFTRETGIRVQASYSSTGKLYAQIKHGAPYDLFLAADEERPQLLHEAKLAEVPVIYASGRTVLWSGRPDLVEETDWQAVLARQDVKRVALPTPEIAPYGQAAFQAMATAGIWELVKPRLVYAQNVAQAFQYGEKRAVDVCFTALSYARSQSGQAGRVWEIETAPAVVQKGCVLTRAANRAAARRLLDFLGASPAKAILATHGYR